MSNGSSIPGRWELVSSENYDEFLKATGVGMIQRTLLGKAKPTLDISVAAGVWTIKTLTTFKNTEISFVPGEEFLEVTEDDRSSTSVVIIEGDRLTHKRQIAGEPSTIVNVFAPPEMKQTLTAKGVTAVRTFKKL